VTPGIEVRRARLSDMEFIRRLSLELVGQGIPENRDIPTAQVLERAQDSLHELDQWILRKRDFAVLVAVDAHKDHVPAGFLILEFHHVEESTGESQSFLFNMGVEEAYWGRYVGHALVREAARITHQRGYRYMTAKVSASNERALLSAIQVGFDIERYQLTMACGAEGPVRMPGRPLAERSHSVSRLLRTRKRREGQQTTSGETP